MLSLFSSIMIGALGRLVGSSIYNTYSNIELHNPAIFATRKIYIPSLTHFHHKERSNTFMKGKVCMRLYVYNIKI